MRNIRGEKIETIIGVDSTSSPSISSPARGEGLLYCTPLCSLTGITHAVAAAADVDGTTFHDDIFSKFGFRNNMRN